MRARTSRAEKEEIRRQASKVLERDNAKNTNTNLDIRVAKAEIVWPGAAVALRRHETEALPAGLHPPSNLGPGAARLGTDDRIV